MCVKIEFFQTGGKPAGKEIKLKNPELVYFRLFYTSLLWFVTKNRGFMFKIRRVGYRNIDS
jgi:hypothetical protein